MSKVSKIPVMEIFGPTIQGEGLMAGTVTHFLRTGGCGLRCEWCDTMFAVDPKQVRAGRTMMTPEEVVGALRSRENAPWVTFTGGDPCLHKSLEHIIFPLNAAGMQIAVETQGQLFPSWLKMVEVVTFSPKPPSSGNIVDYKNMAEQIRDMYGPTPQQRHTKICIKVVVFDQADLEYALDVYNALPYGMYDSFYFTAGTTQEIPRPVDDGTNAEAFAEYTVEKTFAVLNAQRWLANQVLAQSNLMNDKVHIGCQQHVLLWPHIEQGV